MFSIYTLSSSAIESFQAIRPMFDMKPLNDTHKSNSNVTQSLYTFMFGFEALFESQEYVNALTQWMNSFWMNSMYIAVAYVLLTFVGVWAMRSRDRYELRAPLIVWNTILALFSILGAVRVWPEFVYSLSNKGVVYSVCNGNYAYSVPGFWAFMFIMSKLPELIDTMFIVLRKQKLIFLHWYHHATVLVYCWYSYKDHTASGRWFMAMNYFVHALMYSYYACKAMRLRVPLFVSQLITTSQIVQMVAGCYVNWIAYRTKTYEPSVECSISFDNIKYSTLMYFSYFVLFFHFFLNAYIFSTCKSRARTNGADKSQTSIQDKTRAKHAAIIDLNNNPFGKAANGKLKSN